MSNQPWFKFFPTDYLLDARVDSLPLEAQAVLLRMWCLCHIEGSCPSDTEEIARKIRLTSQCVTKHWEQLSSFFDLRDRRLYSRRMEEEKKRSERARKNANERYKPKQRQVLESKSKSKSESESERGSAVSTASRTANCSATRTTARAHQMPDDFRPTDAHVDLANELGVDLSSAFQAFVDFHLSKGSVFKDWDRAFNTWLRNEKRFRGVNSTNGNRKPTIEERGARRKRWYGHYYIYEVDTTGREMRRHVGVPLGEKTKLRKWEAEDKLRKIIAAVTKAQPKPNHLTLAWFACERFLPMRQAQWAPSTRETNLYILEHHILPQLGEKALCEIEKFHCQVFLNGLAEKRFSFTVVDHCRTMLKAILEEAVEADLLGKNPARKLFNPETKKEAQKHVLPKTDARRLLEALPLRDQLIAMIAAFCAMRPGEIFGLCWSSWKGADFHIQGTAWRGKLRAGKAKTDNSLKPVAIPDVLFPALENWRRLNPTVPPDALLFPTERGTPIRPENWLRRRIQPVATALGIAGPVNFQVLRRTFATNAQTLGSAKDVQAHLRHTDIGTTLNIYVQPIEPSTRKLVNDVAHDVMNAKLVTEQIQ